MQGWTADPQGGACSAPKVSARKAIAIDQASAGAHALLGAIYIRYADYDRALDEMRRAVELNSSDPDAYAGLATALLWSGDVDAIGEGLSRPPPSSVSTSRPTMLSSSASPICSPTATPTRSARSNARSSATRPTSTPMRFWPRPMRRPAARTMPRGKRETVRRLDPRFDSADFGSLLRKPELRDEACRRAQQSGALGSLLSSARSCWPSSRWPFRRWRPAACWNFGTPPLPEKT